MGLRIMPEAAKERISRNVLAKKICRMKKQLRTLKISNSSLKNTNKELVLTVQSLKENLREAENKLRSLNGELCNAIAVRNAYQESHQKLAVFTQELAGYLQGTSGVVAKVCGVLSETTARASNAFHAPGFQDTSSNYEYTRQTTETVNDALVRIREFERNFTTIQGNAADERLTLPPVQNGTGERVDRNINDNSPDAQSNRTIHVYNAMHLPPNCYRVSVKPFLSPVEERTSQLSDYTFKNTNEEESIDDPDNDDYESADDEPIEKKPVLLIPKPEVIEETYEQTEPSEKFLDDHEEQTEPSEQFLDDHEELVQPSDVMTEQFPEDHEELVQPSDVMREQFPEDHEIQPQPPDVTEQIPDHESFEDSRNENRDVFQRTTLPYPGSEMEILLQSRSETLHQSDEPVPSSPEDRLSEVENLTPGLTASSSKFSKVFPRRKKFVSTVNDTMESEEGSQVEEVQQGDPYEQKNEQNQEDGNKQENEEEHEQQVEHLPVEQQKEELIGLSEEKNCTKEDSTSKPSTSPPSRVSIRSEDSLKEAEGSPPNETHSHHDSSTEELNAEPPSSPLRRVSSNSMKRTVSELEDTTSKEKNTRKKKTFCPSKRVPSRTRQDTENGLEDTPPKEKKYRKKKIFSPSRKSPRIIMNQFQDTQRRTRKMVKNYTEPTLKTKLRR